MEPEVARYAPLTGAGLGLLLLKHSRDDERQADDLGLVVDAFYRRNPGLRDVECSFALDEIQNRPDYLRRRLDEVVELLQKERKRKEQR